MRIGTFVVSRDGDLEVRRHAIEDAFVISIEDGVIETIKTVGDLVALVKRTDCLRQATSGSGLGFIWTFQSSTSTPTRKERY